ncbi:MAG: vacuolar family H+-ATPase subunit H [Eubacteriales bacterium]|nr:vacuolar family H+-ATPase subunit H [Eubacteriales bacterium]
MSRIEQLINEIEEYIDSCKYQPLSNTKILVNKEEMEELLVELRLRVPDEIKKYQKIISQQDAILADARTQAENMIADATAQTNELVSDHEVMQRAYAKANEVIEDAKREAQSILDSAVGDANNIRQSAVQYTDSLLANVQGIMENSMDSTRQRFDAMFNALNSTYEVCIQNRQELAAGMQQPETAAQNVQTEYAQPEDEQ